MMVLLLTMDEALELDRLLDIIKQGVKEKRSYIRVPLDNTHFTSTLEGIAKKKYIQLADKEEKEKNNG
jgi:hypothetical protein